jgi:hypothetical protein
MRSPSQLEQALREVTERLAAELGTPTLPAPVWSAMQWRVARAVAAMHGVSPLLAHCSNWQGPAEWSRFLADQRRHTARRHVRICGLLRRIDAGARAGGFAVMALKGSALHGLGLYAAGDRPMADIDLLVQPADAAPLGALLESMDYRLANADWRESVYVPAVSHDPAPLGEHAGNDVKIEAHERIAERLAWRVTDVTNSILPIAPRPGLNSYDSKAALMKHLLLHAAGSISRQSLRLLQLHDIALLAANMAPADWHELERGASRHSLWWAYPPLRIAYRYYPRVIPADVLALAAGACPLWLRSAAARASLYEVSLSYPWVDAFPAMAWARSLRELCDYIANRLRPSASLLAARRRTLETEHWARRAAWGGLPQGRRILRWAISRPTRPATLHALTAAFTRGEALGVAAGRARP